MACANAGLDVTITDTEQALAGQGTRHHRAQLRDVGLARTADGRRRARRAWAASRPKAGATSFETADLVIEAAFENLAVKQDIFRRLDAGTRPGCILATNTSTLDIDAIASATSRAPAVIGLHFFSPAHVMRLVEIVRGARHGPGHRGRRAGARQAPGQGRRGRRQRLRLRRQPADAALHVRGAVPGRRRGDTAAGGPGADRLRDGDGHLCRGRHGGPGRGVARAAGAPAVCREPAPAARRRPAVRDGPVRPEDGRRLVSLRRRPQGGARRRGGGAHRAPGARRRDHPPRRSATPRSWIA